MGLSQGDRPTRQAAGEDIGLRQRDRELESGQCYYFEIGSERGMGDWRQSRDYERSGALGRGDVEEQECERGLGCIQGEEGPQMVPVTYLERAFQ